MNDNEKILMPQKLERQFSWQEKHCKKAEWLLVKDAFAFLTITCDNTMYYIGEKK